MDSFKGKTNLDKQVEGECADDELTQIQSENPSHVPDGEATPTILLGAGSEKTQVQNVEAHQRNIEGDDKKTVLVGDEPEVRSGTETTLFAGGEKTKVIDSSTDAAATKILDKTMVIEEGENTVSFSASAETQVQADATVAQTSTATLVSDTTRTAPVTSSSPLAKMVSGYVIKDRFVLERKLGEGGMGAVFHARDLRKEEARDPNPYVAIKVITGLLQKNSKAVIALQRETKKSQTLAHPNVITVYDFDRDGEIYYMTMESLQGQTLDDYIESGDGDEAEKIRFINDIANGVAYAHKRNIIHSDLKPENVFVTKDKEIKILDFGIARAFAQGESQAVDPDELVGLTPTYASCEMFEGQDPHPSDDVYALGLMAYELLSGKHPFGRRSALEACKESKVAKKLKGIKSYQWSAISSALQFKREVRLSDSIEFQRKFSGAGLLVKRLVSALIAVMCGFAVYIAFFQPEAGPDIPFVDLPPAVQQEVLAKLSEGGQALQFGDVNGALFYFDEAYSLHPRNKDVVAALDSVIEQVLSRYQQEGIPVEQQRIEIAELLKYGSLAQNKKLIDLKSELNVQ